MVSLLSKHGGHVPAILTLTSEYCSIVGNQKHWQEKVVMLILQENRLDNCAVDTVHIFT